jgi:hypothetical protein
MYDETIVDGRVASMDTPDWYPLEKFLPIELCGPFMRMHSTALDDGRKLQAYKHSLTRHYLLLDADGDSYEDLGRGRYRRMRHSDAIEQVLTPWWVLHHADENESARLSGKHLPPLGIAAMATKQPAVTFSRAHRRARSVAYREAASSPVRLSTLATIRRATGSDHLR